jgi:hypothetical protein
MTIFAPSSAEELKVMMSTAVQLSGPSVVRYPKTAARHVPADQVGSGLHARLVRRGDGSVCMLAVGKMLEACEEAAALLSAEGVEVTLWDVRVVRPLDPAMVTDAGKHAFVVTIEDGTRNGGAGHYIADAIADLNPSRQSPPVLSLGVPTSYIPQAPPGRILGQLGLDGPGIAASIFKAVEHASDHSLAESNGSAPDSESSSQDHTTGIVNGSPRSRARGHKANGRKSDVTRADVPRADVPRADVAGDDPATTRGLPVTPLVGPATAP